MAKKLPAAKPQMKHDQVDLILKKKKIDRDKNPVVVLAVRGYFMDTMGELKKNDRGIFDDAAFVSSPSAFTAVNFNTDPSSYRKGRGTGAYKGMASLEPGVWNYKIGKHKGKGPAGVQNGKVTVMRDGTDGNYSETGYFGINLHWGSVSGGTSSAGCQTAPPMQFKAFINTVVDECKRYKTDGKFLYVLITEQERKDLLAI